MARALSRKAWLLGLGVLAAVLAFVWARREPPAVSPLPRVDEVIPLGVRRGYASELTVRGSALLGNPRLVAPFRFVVATPGPSGSDANTFETRITVDPNTPLGIYPVRVLTEEGLSNPFALAIGQLPEIEENEDNDDIDTTAQMLALPTVIEGWLPEGDYDTFRFRGKKGQRIVALIECGEIGSGIQTSPLGLVSLDRKFQGDLSSLRLPVGLPKDDDYLFGVRFERAFRVKSGRPVYRLTIGDLPAAAEVYPLGGRRGETIRVELRGGTLDGLKVIPVTLVPAQGENIVRLRVASDVRGPDGTLLDVEALPPMVVSDLPDLLEPPAPDAPPLRAAAPVVFNGRIDPPGDEDRFTLIVTPGQTLRVDVAARYDRSMNHAGLKVLDARGNELSLVSETNVPARDGVPEHERFDPLAEFTVPAGQTEVTLVLFDKWLGTRPKEGGIEYPYRIEVIPVVPGFDVALNDAQVSVPKGGAAAVGVSVTRKGFSGPVTLRVADPPAGLTFRPGTVAEGQTKGAFTLAATADAAFEPVVLDVICEGRGPGGPIVARASKVILFGEPTTMPFRLLADRIDGKPVYHEFPAYLRTSILTQPGLFAATAKASPLTLDAPAGTIKVTQGRGTTFKVTATRPKGAEGALTLNTLPLPSGLSIPQAMIGETETETTVTVNATREHPPGAVTVVLTARGKIAAPSGG